MKDRSLWLLLTLAVSYPTHAEKTDIVIFANGDRLTGEVKSLERGRLRFDTDATGTIAIEWDDVAYLDSNQNVQVETATGRRYLGALRRDDRAGTLIVTTDSGPVELPMPDVVLMTPIEERGISRLDGDVYAGYGFTKASDVQQFNVGLDLEFRSEIRSVSLDADATVSDSEAVDVSQRLRLDLESIRLWPDRWITGSVISLNRNDELGVDLRTSIGAGGGRILRQTNSTNLALDGGIQLSRENVSADTPDEDTWEGFVRLRWDWFRYDTPELDLATHLKVIPNLTDTGRVRGEFDVSLRWEIVEDLFWQLSFYDAYDSDPIVEDAEKNDYGVNTSLGWDF